MVVAMEVCITPALAAVVLLDIARQVGMEEETPAQAHRQLAVEVVAEAEAGMMSTFSLPELANILVAVVAVA